MPVQHVLSLDVPYRPPYPRLVAPSADLPSLHLLWRSSCSPTGRSRTVHQPHLPGVLAPTLSVCPRVHQDVAARSPGERGALEHRRLRLRLSSSQRRGGDLILACTSPQQACQRLRIRITSCQELPPAAPRQLVAYLPSSVHIQNTGPQGDSRPQLAPQPGELLTPVPYRGMRTHTLGARPWTPTCIHMYACDFAFSSLPGCRRARLSPSFGQLHSWRPGRVRQLLFASQDTGWPRCPRSCRPDGVGPYRSSAT